MPDAAPGGGRVHIIGWQNVNAKHQTPNIECRMENKGGCSYTFTFDVRCWMFDVRCSAFAFKSTAMALKVGIIGYGRIGREHAQWMRDTDTVTPVAVFDPTSACCDRASFDSLQTFDTLDAFLAEPNLDAVLVSTPTRFHVEYALAALAAGKHVMIEKPMAIDLGGAKQIAAAAGDSVVSVFHNRRWDADYLAVRAAVKAGVLGRVFNVESRLGQWGSCVGPAAVEWRPGWRNEAVYGGGGWYDWGSHFVDQIWQLLAPAKPVRVFAQLRGNVWTTDCDDLARVCIDFDDNCIAMVEINTTTTRPLPRWHLDGARGSIDSPFSESFDTNEWARLTFDPADDSIAPPVTEPDVALTETDIWTRFADAVAGRGEPAVTLASVLPTMRLLDAARLSSHTGQAVTLDDRP